MKIQKQKKKLIIQIIDQINIKNINFKWFFIDPIQPNIDLFINFFIDHSWGK